MIHFTERLNHALCVAASAHERQGQHRKGSQVPYIIHPVGTMLIAGQVTDDEDILVACLLHDVLEDVSREIYSEGDMRRDFGDRVVSFVLDVTKNDDIKNWHERSKAYLSHLEHGAHDEALLVSVADKIHNLQSVVSDYKRIGEDIWRIFSTGQADDQIWWYRSVAEVMKRRGVERTLVDRLESDIAELQALRSSQPSEKQQAGHTAKD